MRFGITSLLFLLGAALCPLGALASDECVMQKVENVFGWAGPKARTRANYGAHLRKYFPTDGERDAICKTQESKKMYMLSMIVDKNFDKETDKSTYGFHFLIFNNHCELKGIYAPNNDAQCEDWTIDDPDVFERDPKTGGKLVMQIHDYRHRPGLAGYFSFTYGAYHAETNEKTGLTGKMYKSCKEVTTTTDGSIKISISACRHRFRIDGEKKDA